MKKFFRGICIVLVFTLIMSIPAYAAEVTPRSSSYISSSSCYLSKTSSTTFAIWFDVIGVGMMDEIGASVIRVQRSKDCSEWTTVKTYYCSDFPQMICENSVGHGSNLIYTGEQGYYYRARVTFYAKDSSGFGNVIETTGTLFLPNTGRQIAE